MLGDDLPRIRRSRLAPVPSTRRPPSPAHRPSTRRGRPPPRTAHHLLDERRVLARQLGSRTAPSGRFASLVPMMKTTTSGSRCDMSSAPCWGQLRSPATAARWTRGSRRRAARPRSLPASSPSDGPSDPASESPPIQSRSGSIGVQARCATRLRCRGVRGGDARARARSRRRAAGVDRRRSATDPCTANAVPAASERDRETRDEAPLPDTPPAGPLLPAGRDRGGVVVGRHGSVDSGRGSPTERSGGKRRRDVFRPTPVRPPDPAACGTGRRTARRAVAARRGGPARRCGRRRSRGSDRH